MSCLYIQVKKTQNKHNDAGVSRLKFKIFPLKCFNQFISKYLSFFHLPKCTHRERLCFNMVVRRYKYNKERVIAP